MRLALSATLVVALALTACAADATPFASRSESDATPTLAPAAPSTAATAPPTTAGATSTTEPARSTDAASPPSTAPACIAPIAPLTTAAGRQVVVRAAGLAGPSPTIMVLHGYTGSPDGIEKFSELTSLANASGVAVMYPQGTATPEGGFGWSSGAGLFATSGTDDVAALAAMIDAAVATGCVDGTRLVISGESNGAGMALVALCDERLERRFSAAVLVIPAIDAGVLTHCEAGHTTPIGVSVVAGRLDDTVGYDEGRPPFFAAEQWFGSVASLVNACPSGSPQRTAVDTLVERLVMPDCAACTEMFTVADGAHTWPGSSRGTRGQSPGSFALSRRLVDLASNAAATCLE